MFMVTLKVHWLNLFAKFSVTERTAAFVTCLTERELQTSDSENSETFIED